MGKNNPRSVYIVTLDGTKCASLTLKGRKYLPFKPSFVAEADIEPFRRTGVFHIQKRGPVGEVAKKAEKKVEKKVEKEQPEASRSTAIAETNPLDKEAPSGVINT